MVNFTVYYYQGTSFTINIINLFINLYHVKRLQSKFSSHVIKNDIKTKIDRVMDIFWLIEWEFIRGY